MENNQLTLKNILNDRNFFRKMKIGFLGFGYKKQLALVLMQAQIILENALMESEAIKFNITDIDSFKIIFQEDYYRDFLYHLSSSPNGMNHEVYYRMHTVSLLRSKVLLAHQKNEEQHIHDLNEYMSTNGIFFDDDYVNNDDIDIILDADTEESEIIQTEHN